MHKIVVSRISGRLTLQGLPELQVCAAQVLRPEVSGSCFCFFFLGEEWFAIFVRAFHNHNASGEGEAEVMMSVRSC